ncbi:MAG: DUF3308 domain-containing protein, partial [Bacteroidota bacterium]|nr:DUF3308 domain-containing protein [Bacteroidota bacterium]
KINTGAVFRIISEGIPDARAQGVSLDAGIQYTSGDYRQLRFGIALRNIGPAMRYSGDGLATRARLLPTEYELTMEQRSAYFELPSLLSMSASYDIALDSSSRNHIITLAGTFVANAFENDQFIAGIQYSMADWLQLRAAYNYQSGLWDDETRNTVFTGPSAGASVQFPFGEERNKNLGFDYSFRASNPFSGTHTFGAHLTF